MDNQRQEIIRGVIHHVNEEPNFDSFDGEKAHPPVPLGHIDTGSLYKGGSDYDLDNDTQASLVNGALPIKAIDERVGDIASLGRDIIQKVFIKLGINVKPQYVNEGSMGIAYTDGNRIYKITTDASEAGDAAKLIGKTNKYLADVYDVHQVKMNGLKSKTYLIICEMVRTDPDHFGELENSLEAIIGRCYGIKTHDENNKLVINTLALFRDDRAEYDLLYKNKLKAELDKFPDENKFWHQLLLITNELKQNGIESLDIHYNNLGYKKNGKVAFFDYGFGGQVAPVSVDTLALENMIYERITSYMKGSQAMTVKKKCQLGGNGDGTSTACNQGDISNIDLKNISEGKDVKIEYGALMLYFDKAGWDKITSIIKKEDIYDKPTFGIEKEPHITILYGFHDDVNADEVLESVKENYNIKNPINVELTNISIFEGEKYDVVKFDAKSKILNELNNVVKKFPHTTDFPDYHPHMTISYVKKGCGKKYIQKLKKNLEVQSSKIIFSTVNGKKTVLKENVLEKSKKGFTLHDMITETVKISLNELPFKHDLEKAGGRVFSVGGAVRDALIGKESKDLDLLVTGLPLDRLESLLMKYGKVDTVGKSFGVIKFNSPQTGELDIAIPRTERPTGQGGYQGFDVTSDHNLPIEKDLERRDFTINAIAKDATGKTVDPYGGEQDIQNKVIRMVNPQAFSDDPLRMIRAVQFAARFGFTIEPKTFEAIQQNASKIKEISPERILIEFDKIVKKGSPAIGAQLLVDTGLYQNIFGVEPKVNVAEFNNVKTMGEFIYQLTKYSVANPAEFYKTKLKGDLDTYNEIKAYDLAYKDQSNNAVQNKLTVFAIYKTFPASVDSPILPDNIKNAVKEMRSMGMPFSFKELQINGNELLAMGYTGQQIGQILKNLLVDVYSGKVRNNNQLLLRQILPVDQNPTKNK